MSSERTVTSYPFSPDERVAMARYVASIRTQLQELSLLFNSRYGNHSSLAGLSAKALVCTTLLEQELLEAEQSSENAPLTNTADNQQEESVMIKTASRR